MIAAWLAFYDSLIAAAMVLAGLVGAYFHLAAPFFGFQLFLFGMLFGVLALIFGLIGVFRTRSPQTRHAHNRAALSTYLGLAITALLVFLAFNARGYPAINDITTDTNNPPEFVAAALIPANRGRDLSYNKAIAERQHSSYATLEPLRIPMDTGRAFKQVADVAASMPGWEVTSVRPETHTLEGVATTKLFHFHDDFIIQVRPNTPAASLVEMRSKSRDGQGDVGANYKRIQAFFAQLSAATNSHGQANAN